MTWDCSDAFVVEDEATGAWTGLVSIPGPLNGWTLALGFSSNVDLLESAAATASGSGLSWELANKDWDAEIPEGQNLSLHFIVIKSPYHIVYGFEIFLMARHAVPQVDYSGERPDLTKLDLEGVSLCRCTLYNSCMGLGTLPCKLLAFEHFCD